MSDTYSHKCRNCKTWIPLTPAQQKKFVSTTKVNLNCPSCGVAQQIDLVTSIPAERPSSPPREVPAAADAAPWGNPNHAPVVSTPAFPVPMAVEPAPAIVAASSRPPAPFDPRDRYRGAETDPTGLENPSGTTAKKGWSERFDDLPKGVQYVALFVPLIVIGVLVMSFFGDGRAPAGPAKPVNATPATKPGQAADPPGVVPPPSPPGAP